jgi:hypothetical protein
MTKGQISRILQPELEGAQQPDHSADQLRLPTLDERATLYLRAVHGERDFTNDERAGARGRILDEIANGIASAVSDECDSTDQEDPAARGRPLDEIADRPAAELGAHSRDPELPGMLGGTRFNAVSLRISKEDLDWPDSSSGIIAESPDYFASVQPPRPIVRRRMFIGAAAITAAVLLFAGAYRLDLIPRNDASPIVTVSRPAPTRELNSLRYNPGGSLVAEPDANNTKFESEFAAHIPPPTPVLPNNQVGVSFASVSSAPTTQPEPQREQLVSASVSGAGPAQVEESLPPSPLPQSLVDAAPGIQPRHSERILRPDEIDELIARGQKFIELGDLSSARIVLERAAQARDPRAALALGSTYDPNVFGRLGIVGVQGQPEKAREWYKKAAELGSREAQDRLTALGALSR